MTMPARTAMFATPDGTPGRRASYTVTLCMWPAMSSTSVTPTLPSSLANCCTVTTGTPRKVTDSDGRVHTGAFFSTSQDGAR